MKKIVICIDNSAYSIKAANIGIALSKSLNADISLVHVVDNRLLITEGDYTPKEWTDTMKAEAKGFLDKVLNMFSFTALSYIEEGKPSEKIIEMAEALEADLIVLGTHGRTGITRVLMGSVAEAVVRRSKIPVLIVPFKAIDKNTP